jgi:DNA processing protein
VIYPSENRSIADKIASSGGLISEFLPGTEPEAGLFPRRNRIISGVSRGVLVIQGDETSGAMITARFALEHNREVFALPGNIEDRRSHGPHQLLREGATLVQSAQDILDAFGASLRDGRAPQLPALPALNSSESEVVAQLSLEPIHIDDLVRLLNRPVASVLADLLGLEMKNWVIQMPGKLFILKYPM